MGIFIYFQIFNKYGIWYSVLCHTEHIFYRSFSFVCGKVWWNVFDAWCLSAKLKLSDLKAFKVSINISNVSCKRCTLLCYAKKDKYLLVFTFTSFFSPSLPNLAPQLRCAQNRYTAVQMDLKYPLSSGRGCGLIILFQLYRFKTGIFESNLFWVGQYDPPPKPSYWKIN